MQVEDHGNYQVLLINNVTAKDGGKYVCQGALDNAEVYLNVNRKFITESVFFKSSIFNGAFQ